MEFYGYRRANGRVGVRNHVLLLPIVGCASELCRNIASHVYGSVYFVNQNGCGETNKNLSQTRKILCGLAKNPNVYGVICVGLGCEINTLFDMLQLLSDAGKRVEGLSIQECGGFANTLAKGMRLAQEMVSAASELQREPCPIAELQLGLECVGSDATSGLVANPVLGYVSDRIVSEGGTVIFSETSEMIGAEDILAGRAATPELAQRIRDLIWQREKDMIDMGEDIRLSQPSPGNKKGGITTIEEKSLGCIYKGGTTPIREFIDYACRPVERGLVLMDTPAYDLCSVTAKIAGGCQMVVFTTGRGNVMGSPVAPVIKMTGNCSIVRGMQDAIDFDCSSVLNTGESIEEAGERLLKQVILTAGGKLTKAEIYGLGASETVISRVCDYL